MTLRDDDLSLEPTSGSAGIEGYSIVLASDRIGTLALRDEGRGTKSLRWNAGTDPAMLDTLVRALTLVLDDAWAHGTTRVEARVPIDRTTDLRAASLCGLRREGIIRTPNQEPGRALMARLASDPPRESRDGFIAQLNAGLPTKRVIGQGVLRDPNGRVLLCELTYKPEWDLPGGVIEVGESPATGLEREIDEELGITVKAGDLITVNWLPPWRGWDDACVFVFDLGELAANAIETMTLQKSEIRAVHWVTLDEAHEHATAATIELLTALDRGPLQPYRDAPKAAE